MSGLSLFPYLGAGLGLRPQHFETILRDKPDVDWFEILTDNYLTPTIQPMHPLLKIRADYPMVMHGVSLGLGSMDPLNKIYLDAVKVLIQQLEPAWVSDHLCWTGAHGIDTHDLLPVPYTEENVAHFVARIQTVQEHWGRPLLIENVSSYLTYAQSDMTEWEFLSRVVQASGAFILLDVNNVFVSAFNHDFDPIHYLQGLPRDRVVQIHLAGHTRYEHYIMDTHDAPVDPAVWDLYRAALARWGAISTVIERDGHIPGLEVLLEEVQQIKVYLQALS